MWPRLAGSEPGWEQDVKGLCMALEGHSRGSSWVGQAKRFAFLRYSWSSHEKGRLEGSWLLQWYKAKVQCGKHWRWEGRTWWAQREVHMG